MPVAITATVAGASIIGGIVSSNNQASAAKTAANDQLQAAQAAQQTQLQMYNQTRQDLSPFLNTGSSALGQLANLWGIGPGGSGTPNSSAAMQALTQFPGYQFGMDQGQKALDRSAASQGLLLSGAQQQASRQFGTNYAMQQAWQPYISQLDQLASLGENAGAQTGNFGASAAAGIAGNQLAAGQAQASGVVGAANAQNAGINGIFNNAALAQLLSGGNGGSYAPTNGFSTGVPGSIPGSGGGVGDFWG